MSEAGDGRARGLGGVFFRSDNPEATRQWYADHLGLNVDAYGTNFAWRHKDEPERPGHTVWSPFKADTEYFGAPEQQFMINFRVENLDALMARFREQGVEIVGEVMEEPYGRFLHIVDSDGRRVELWEPVDAEYEKIVEAETK